MTPESTPSPPTNADPPTPQQREAAVTIFERSVAGRRAGVLPPTDADGFDETPLSELIRSACCAPRVPPCPRSPSPRSSAITTGSRRNFDLDTGPYPLGSCTMKHNPRLNERVAALPGTPRLHPAQDAKRAQGALELMWRLERAWRSSAVSRTSRSSPPRLARRARRPAADQGLPRGRGRAPAQGAHAGHRARHQPGDGDDGRLRGGQGRHR